MRAAWCLLLLLPISVAAETPRALQLYRDATSAAIEHCASVWLERLMSSDEKKHRAAEVCTSEAEKAARPLLSKALAATTGAAQAALREYSAAWTIAIRDAHYRVGVDGEGRYERRVSAALRRLDESWIRVEAQLAR